VAGFSSFVKTLTADGKQFEYFVKWFLRNDPEWSTQVDQIWLWDEYPERWGRDCGIDLVFRHKNGDTWAVQAKNYAPDYYIKKKDVDSFISESNRESIDHRLLICSTDLIGSNARRVCDAQSPLVVRYMLWDFEQAGIDYPSSFKDLSNAKRIEPPKPRSYQQTAIDDVVAGFENADRGQLIMACGTGKTFTSLWIKEKLNAKTVLVLLPSLSLLSQTLREWTLAANNEFDVLCVCSDKTVAKRGSDEAISSVSDVAFPVTSDVQDIREFLKGDTDKVIFSTYQSSQLISEAQTNKTLPNFDIAFADEAHRCAGKADGLFSTVLNQNQIRANKRLFMTATPRTYSTRIKKSAEVRGVDMVDMDDEVVFGKVLHSLSFGEAITHTPPLLTDYRVVIIGVDEPMIAEWIERREIVETDSGLTTDAESLAAQIGLLKAIKDYDLNRVISFHSRVNRAKAFSEDIQIAIQDLTVDYRPTGAVWADHVSGKMPTGKRRLKLDYLKALGKDQVGLLSNAQCLSEGVDVPSLDGVAFIDPRRSQIDIIQAVGRAIRLSGNKTAGTIVLPVFIKNSEDAEQSIETSRFKPIWSVLNALKAHDDVLSEQLDQLRTRLGRHPGSNIESDDLSKIVIDVPKTIDSSFARSIRTVLVEKTTESWDFWFGILCRYVEENEDSIVPSKYVTDDGYTLGTWVQHQRSSRGRISDRRSALLESLPCWTWEWAETRWAEGYEQLSAYIAKNKHSLVPQDHITSNGYKLGSWVAVQRKSQNKLTSSQRKSLEELPDWVWRRHETLWEANYQALKAYESEYKNCRVPKLYETEDGLKLGQWVADQRKKRSKLSQDQKNRIVDLKGWVWHEREARWEEHFEALLKYTAEYKTSLVYNSMFAILVLNHQRRMTIWRHVTR